MFFWTPYSSQIFSPGRLMILVFFMTENFCCLHPFTKDKNSSLTSLLEIICSGEAKLLAKINTVCSEFNSISHDSSLKTQTSCSHPSSPKLGYCNKRSRLVILGFFYLYSDLVVGRISYFTSQFKSKTLTKQQISLILSRQFKKLEI